jgi:sugar/nucleoside kinase (ribokinase family)
VVTVKARVCVVGDCALDVTAAPSATPARGGDRPATIRVGPGGQAANVAVRLARRGVAVRLVTALGADLAGDWLRAALVADGVEVVAGVAPTPRATSIVIAVLDEAGERTMLSDRSPLAVNGPELAEVVATSDWIHCSGYVLRNPAEARPIMDVLAGREDRTPLSLAGGSAGDARTAASLRTAIRGSRPELLVLSIDEARWLAADPHADAAALLSRLADLAGAVVVTAGAEGADARLGGGSVVHVPAANVGPGLDATGAGDAFTAALLEQVIGGAWPPAPDRLRTALAAASRAGGEAARVAGAQGRIGGERGTGTVSGT